MALLDFLKPKRTSIEDLEEKLEKNSDNPWVKIVGEEVDPKHGIKIELDWNDAFIEYLRRNGIDGVGEEQVVQKWLALLYKDIMDNMSEEQGGTDFD